MSAEGQLFRKAPYAAGWDINFSPYAGGENVLFATRFTERVAEKLYGTKIGYTKQASHRFWRVAELYFVWLPLNYLGIIAQHEVFGHGYRIRDVSRGRAKVGGYDVGTPPPYGYGGASTSYSIGDNLTTTEDVAISMAGIEATAILAQLTKLKWMSSGRIDPRQTVLYLLGQYDLPLYIDTLKVKNDEDLDGHDLHAYVKSLNYTYTSSFINSGRLRSLSWINLADPFTYYSIYAWLRYVSSGKETQIPMIPVWKMGYLPTLRLGLSPFGPEVFIENYLLDQKKPIYFYLKGGNHAENRYAGLGFYAPKIWNIYQWHVGFRFDAWRQPKLLLSQGSVPFEEIDFDETPDKEDPIYSYSEQHAMRAGVAGSMIIAFGARQGFEMELGYKSQGFLPGYALRASPTARLFYTLTF